MQTDTLSHAIAVPYLVEISAFLLGVVVIVPLFRKIGISPILGFLTAGALIGPHTLGVIEDAEGVQHFAELGVIFLLFTIGLELSFERLRSFAGLIFGLGTAQVVLCALAIAGIAYAWGNDAPSAVIIGLCLSLSSTAMVVQLLQERGEMSTKHGRSAFSVLLFQDLAVVPILILLSILGSDEDGGIVSSIATALFNAAIAITLIVLLGRFGLRKLFLTVARTRSIEVFTALTLLTILAISMATGIAGLSMALGAFLAGLLLAETEFRHQIEGEIEPFKGLFLGLFFMAVGMNIDFAAAFESGVWVVLAVLGLIALKLIITLGCCLVFRLRLPEAIRASFILSEAGEFAFVVIGQATLTYGLIDHETGQFMVVVAGLSMMLTPLLAYLGDRCARLVTHNNEGTVDELTDEDIHGHIVIAGFGRVGKVVADVLREDAIPYIAIDTDADDVKRLRASERSLYVGDASRTEVLKRTGVERAAALLITMNSPDAAVRTLHVARQHWPDLTIIVRSRDLSHAQDLIDAGATQVVPETLEASMQLSNYVLRATGYSRDEANDRIDALRKMSFSHMESH